MEGAGVGMGSVVGAGIVVMLLQLANKRAEASDSEESQVLLIWKVIRESFVITVSNRGFMHNLVNPLRV